MWIKLTGEYINLAHIVRVRAAKSFRNGRDEWSVELEGIFQGQLQLLSRYRGADAETLLAALHQSRAPLDSMAVTVTSQEMAGTVSDQKIY